MNKFTSFSRHVEKVWLEQTLACVATGATRDRLNQQLEALLTAKVATAENRRKARNLLVSIWAPREQADLAAFDSTAINIYRKTEQSSLVLQWGMLVARKPFFAAVARFIGRYSKLNDGFHYVQVNKRMCELYGETESTSRSTRAVLKTMQELGVLSKDQSGLMVPVAETKVIAADEVNWLIRGQLLSDCQTSRALDEALQDPIWFPFQLVLNTNQINSAWFDLHQQGNSLYLFLKQDVS